MADSAPTITTNATTGSGWQYFTFGGPIEKKVSKVEIEHLDSGGYIATINGVRSVYESYSRMAMALWDKFEPKPKKAPKKKKRAKKKAV